MNLRMRRTRQDEEARRRHVGEEVPRRNGDEDAPQQAPSERRTDALASERERPGTREQVAAGERRGEGRPIARERGRRRWGWKARDMGASAVGTVGSGVMLLARGVMTLATLIAILIALAIILVDVGANGHNTIVKGIHEGANFFAGAFTGLIAFNGHPKRAITVDWGIALVVYLIVGAIVAEAIARVGRGGRRYERTHRAVV